MLIDAKDKVFTLLYNMGISYEVVYHGAVFTIEDMENLHMEHIDKVAKNLFVRDDRKRNYYLLVIQKDKSANLKELQRQIGSRRLSFASENDLNRYLGLNKGEVTPFGVLNDSEKAVTVIIDRDLANYAFIGVHPNDNTATVWIALNDLLTVLEATGHKARFIDMTEYPDSTHST